MESYLPISWLNDFIFCPYSIYWHQVFESGLEESFSALPQQKGKTAHQHIDKKDCNESAWFSPYVISNKLKVYGKIDCYYPKRKILMEYKRNIKTIYKGYYYQIWAQYFCMIEMGFEVNSIQFVSIKDKKHINLKLPEKTEYVELYKHIMKIAQFDPYNFQHIPNINKCKHCIYAMLCDKTNMEHVYA